MSCMITSAETVKQIAVFTEKVLNMGFDYFGFIASEELYSELNDCMKLGYYEAELIYNRLYEMNIAAYNGRYSGNKLIDTGIVYPTYYNVNSPSICETYEYNGHYIVKPWHYQILKHLDFYLYQCNENGVYRTELFKAMASLRKILANFIICNTDIYADLPWE